MKYQAKSRSERFVISTVDNCSVFNVHCLFFSGKNSRKHKEMSVLAKADDSYPQYCFPAGFLEKFIPGFM